MEVVPNTLMAQVIESGQPILVDLLTNQAGTFLVSRLPLRDAQGEVIGALGMVLCKVLPPAEALGRAINYDTLLLLFGMMVICAYLVEARVFRTISYLTLMHVSSARTLLVAVVAVAGLLSAVLVNDTVCLMVTPLVLQCCRDAKLPPLPYLLAVCFVGSVISQL